MNHRLARKPKVCSQNKSASELLSFRAPGLALAIATLLGNLLPAVAYAAPDGGSYGISYTFAYWPNFLVFVFLLYLILKKPFPKFWLERAETIESKVKSGEQQLQLAQEKLSEARTLYASIDQEISKIRENIVIEGEKEAQAIIDEAKQQSKRIMVQAKATLEIEQRGLLEAARLRLSELALERAREKLKQSVSAEMDQNLRKSAFGNIDKIMGHQGGIQ